MFLDATFYEFDRALFEFWHGLECGFLTTFSEIMAVFGKGGIFMTIFAVVLLLFKKTRKYGFAVAISIAIGAIFTNLILKNVVGRLRPYTKSEYQEWWHAVGSHVESDLSFPSGHMTVVTATFTAIFFTSKNKVKALWTAIPILFMGISRNYLIVHYATDVIAGFIVGFVASIIAMAINSFIWKKINENAEHKFSKFMLSADVINLFRKKSF